MKFPVKQQNQTVNAKGWGQETIVHNNENYCVKLLNLQQGGQCSLHFHKKKEESFLVLEGHVEVELFYDLERKYVDLRRGESIDIPPFMAHRFRAIENSRLLEASNQDLEEADLIRIESGDTQKNKILPIDDAEFIKWEQDCKAIIGDR